MLPGGEGHEEGELSKGGSTGVQAYESKVVGRLRITPDIRPVYILVGRKFYGWTHFMELQIFCRTT